MKKFYLLALLCVWCYTMVAQVTANPSPIPVGYTGEVVLTFDPTKGSGGMVNATECYSHIGLITNLSKDIHDWKYIKFNNQWGTKSEPKWSKVGDNWQLTINNLYTYFGCPETEAITAIVMVFHDGNGSSSKEGKSTAGGDILVGIGEEIPADIWDNYNPAEVQTQARPSGVVNGIYYGTDGTSVTLCTYAANKDNEPAKHVFLVGDMTGWKIKNEYQLKRDGNYFWITLTGLEKGKEYRFQYAIERADGVKKQISDLFSEKVISPDDDYLRENNPDLIAYPLYGADGYVSVIQPGKPAYTWSSATLNFTRPNKNNLVIYEMWVYDHTPNRNFEGLMERLDYLQNLGVNAIELMPINEFDSNYSWGYCPNHYFALENMYGTPEQFKAFVDECHKRGIAVIVEMAFDYATGNNPMNKLYPYGTDLTKNPWFNVTAPHPDGMYEDWNHGFEPTRDHFTRVLKYWLQEYKIDGFKLQNSHGLCSNVAQTSVENLKYYYDNGVKAVSPDAYFILEHWGENMGSERPQLVEAGMMCWENTCTAFQQTAMGWLKDGDDFGRANQDRYVSYCENHDEERCFFKAKQWGNGDLQTNEANRAKRIPMNLGFQCMLNGPQMFYHFAEIGFDFSQYQNAEGIWGQDGVDAYGTSTATPSINEIVKSLVKARPGYLGWFNAGPRMAGYQRLAKILQLRTKLMPSVFAGNPTSAELGSGKALRTIQWGSNVFVVANFSAIDTLSVALPSGTWYDYLDGNGRANSTYSLAPGDIKVFTGSQLTVPTIPSEYKFDSEPAIDNTITVAEALEIGGKLAVGKSTEEEYTIRGYVSYLDSYRPFDEKYGTQCFYVTDDISAAAYSLETGGFYVYLGKPNTGKALKGGEYVEFTTSIYRYKENVIENRAQNMTVTVLKEAPECRVFKGACGENLTWTLDCKGHLVISGTGAMYNYEKGAAPWCQYDVSVATIENGVTSLGKYAFCRCSMDSIFISASVNRIAFNTFNNCYNLQNFEVADENTVFSSVKGVLFNKNQTRIVRFPRGRSGEYVIPDGVETVGAGAFNGCTEVTSVILPSSVVTIDYAAFWNCQLQSVTIPAKVDSIGIITFGYCPLTSVINYSEKPQKLHSDSIAFEGVDLSSCTLYVPKKSIAAYKAANLWKDFGSIQAIDAEDVTEPITTVETEPQDNGVTITWPASNLADTYEIDIFKNETLVCRLTFSADGRLLGIAFAPGRNKAHNARYATQTTTGWQFTITSLESGTKYDYTVIAKKSDDTPAYTQSGSFTTTGSATAIDATVNGQSSDGILLIDGHFYIVYDGKMYDVTGKEMR